MTITMYIAYIIACRIMYCAYLLTNNMAKHIIMRCKLFIQFNIDKRKDNYRNWQMYRYISSTSKIASHGMNSRS